MSSLKNYYEHFVDFVEHDELEQLYFMFYSNLPYFNLLILNLLVKPLNLQ